jgi:formate hydrogenlyase subunit 3/multisubunit Na+/H+ antiporter MnhD subunit
VKPAQVETLAWVLIYGGLLVLVLGLSWQRTDDAWGWSLVVAGGCVAAAGAVLVGVRSKMKD